MRSVEDGIEDYLADGRHEQERMIQKIMPLAERLSEEKILPASNPVWLPPNESEDENGEAKV